MLYSWHPWAGCVVQVDEVIEKSSGDVLRCAKIGTSTGSKLELPVWMFDRASCIPMQIATCPCVNLAALSALWSILAEAARGDGKPSSNAPVWGAARALREQNRGDNHALPALPSRESPETSPSTRSVRSAGRGEGERRSGGADMAHAPRRDASIGDGSHGAAHPRTRARRSRSSTGGGDR